MPKFHSSSEMSTLPVFEWIHRCIVLLEHRLFSPPSNQQSSTIIFSHFHADLFAFIALLLPKVSPPDLPPGLYERLLNLCLKIFQNVSLLPGISSADSQVEITSYLIPNHHRVFISKEKFFFSGLHSSDERASVDLEELRRSQACTIFN